ncbi:MAG: hypothetical protein NC131_11185 [Roseburia sp.]|nr:hypothetical protein [Roseburia sp.]
MLLKSKKILFSIIGAILLSTLVLFMVASNSYTASANTETDKGENVVMSLNEEVEPYGLFTNLSLSINGGDGKVWATVRNDFTLLPSTVNVIVQLYCSSTYQEDYNNMTLIAYNSILDLDMGKTIVAEASTNGEEKFWIARMRYRIDSQAWKEDIVGPARYNANGDFLGLT